MIHVVEFVGGPLDGYAHRFQYTPEELAPEIELEINADVLRVLEGEGDRPIGPPTSLALYHLTAGTDARWYVHVRSVAAGSVSQLLEIPASWARYLNLGSLRGG